MDDHCPNCEAEIQVKYKEDGLEEMELKTKHQHKGYLDLENCPECGFNFQPGELALIEDKRTKLPVEPPEGSKIDSFRYSDSILEITVPKEGFSAKVMGPLIFGVLWLTFVAFWTLMAMQGSILFAMFSIPFWTAGVSMIYGVTKAIFESQKIELNGNTLKITKGRLLNSQEEEFPLASIRKIEMKRVSRTKQVTSMSKPASIINRKQKVPTIIFNDGTEETILNYGSEKEKIWITRLLNEYLTHVHGEV